MRRLTGGALSRFLGVFLYLPLAFGLVLSSAPAASAGAANASATSAAPAKVVRELTEKRTNSSESYLL